MYELKWSYSGLNGPHLNIKRGNKWIGYFYFDCENREEEEKKLREVLENNPPVGGLSTECKTKS